MKRIILLAGLAMSASGVAQAHDYTLGTIKIDHPWARPTPAGTKVGAAYLSLQNGGNETDTLVSAASPIAGKTQIHATIQDGSVMKMRPVEGGVALAPGATVDFKPGGYHIMLLDLKKKLDQGQHVPLTLTFAKAGAIQVEVYVETPGSGQQQGGTMHDMKGVDHGMH
jgi:periplasmic copper chaperone A